MKIVCKECNFSVEIADERIPSKGAKVRCPQCAHLFFISPRTAQSPDKDKTQIPHVPPQSCTDSPVQKSAQKEETGKQELSSSQSISSVPKSADEDKTKEQISQPETRSSSSVPKSADEDKTKEQISQTEIRSTSSVLESAKEQGNCHSKARIKLYWLQCGACGGDTWAMFNAEHMLPFDFFDNYNIDLLWHSSLSAKSIQEQRQLQEDLIAGKEKLDILCIEGSVIRGPGGTGMFDTVSGKPKKDLLASLVRQAEYVLAVGTCASFGGMGADSGIEATGLQFHKWEPGGFLGENFRTRTGMKVINLPGCPCHGGVITGAISALIDGIPLELGRYNEPLEWYDTMVHQGCTRNEYHEYRVEEKKFGEKGCLFFYLGCHGPLVYGPCNKMLWNRRSSKTRVGVPCFGCTRPDFPQQYPFFRTRNIEGIPIELPDGVNRAHYLAYKGIAAAAAPTRLRNRITGI